MKILLLCHSFNSLTQKIFVMLQARGHIVSVDFDVNDALTRNAIERFQPDLIIAPFLKRAIPADIWQTICCLVIHPGLVGDRGPAALDHAILQQQTRWGVTVLQANELWDGGDVYASAEFDLPNQIRKGALYRKQVADAAIIALTQALQKIAQGEAPIPQALLATQGLLKGQWNDPIPQASRVINWSSMTSEDILRHSNSADGQPGILAEVNSQTLRLFDVHLETQLSGEPGEILGSCHGAICIATLDAAVWIGQMALPKNVQLTSFKLPATRLMQQLQIDCPMITQAHDYHDIRVELIDDRAFIYFDFYNGAMNSDNCVRLQATLQTVARSSINTLVLMGGDDFWSNGLDLNCIEAADSPADESWRNINAMNDLCETILHMENKFVVAVMRGNAGAGGVFFALSADRVLATEDIILNPHYKSMGNLYGSEYWTYLLPKRVGHHTAKTIMQQRLPVSAAQAYELGLIDRVLTGDTSNDVESALLTYLDNIDITQAITQKTKQRQQDEEIKPLQQYRDEELAHMKLNFYGFDSSYHVARYHFVHKTPRSRTPNYLVKL